MVCLYDRVCDHWDYWKCWEFFVMVLSLLCCLIKKGDQIYDVLQNYQRNHEGNYYGVDTLNCHHYLSLCDYEREDISNNFLWRLFIKWIILASSIVRLHTRKSYQKLWFRRHAKFTIRTYGRGFYSNWSHNYFSQL